MSKPPPPDECAQCGVEIPRQARACPECGADERTGWREMSVYDGLDLPPESFEEGSEKPARRDRERAVNGLAWYWWVVAVALLTLVATGVFSALGSR